MRSHADTQTFCVSREMPYVSTHTMQTDSANAYILQSNWQLQLQYYVTNTYTNSTAIQCLHVYFVNYLLCFVFRG